MTNRDRDSAALGGPPTADRRGEDWFPPADFDGAADGFPERGVMFGHRDPAGGGRHQVVGGDEVFGGKHAQFGRSR